jgi:hypothetical protein
MTIDISDANFLQSYLINTRVYGVVVPPGQPPEFLATYEIQGDQGTLLMAVAVGPEGPAGANMFALDLQNDTVDTPADLPTDLTDTVADIGRYWVIDDLAGDGETTIGSSLYIWYGTRWKQLKLGSPGPQGPLPIITPTLTVVSPTAVSTVATTGPPQTPTMAFDLALPPGEQGPAAALALCPDVDLSTHAPVPGDVLGFTGTYTNGLLSPPAHLVAIAGAGSGPAAGTYYYVVTGINAAGQTTASNEVTIAVGGSSTVHLSWQPAGAGNFGPTNYKIYRGTSAGGENKLIGTVSGSTLTFSDTGIAGSTSSPPGTSGATVAFPVWVPVSISQLIPSPFSMPEGSFTSFSGISQAAAIGSFAIPPQPFPWTPIVWGHIGAFGVELSANPLMIGCQVLLGDPTSGATVARGFGNSLGEVNIMPHYSSPGQPSVAITPTNSLAVVPANHTNPAQGTIYVNLYNDGEIGLYTFSPTDAQIFIQLTPISEGGGS